MNDKVTDRLNVIIQDASLDGTLSKRAIDLFHGILKENEELHTELDDTHKRLKDLAEKSVKLTEQRDNMQKQILLNAERETKLEEREQKMTTLELTAKHEAKRVEDHKEMFGQVFRNLEMRRTVFPVSPSQHINDQGMTAPGGYVEERVQTEKTE